MRLGAACDHGKKKKRDGDVHQQADRVGLALPPGLPRGRPHLRFLRGGVCARLELAARVEEAAVLVRGVGADAGRMGAQLGESLARTVGFFPRMRARFDGASKNKQAQRGEFGGHGVCGWGVVCGCECDAVLDRSLGVQLGRPRPQRRRYGGEFVEEEVVSCVPRHVYSVFIGHLVFPILLVDEEHRLLYA